MTGNLPAELSTLADAHLCRTAGAGSPAMSQEAEGELVVWLREVLEKE
jgi:hypothetical protein